MEFDASNEPKKNAFQLFVAGLHRGGVVGVRPARRAETPEVEHGGADAGARAGTGAPTRGRARDRAGTLGARRAGRGSRRDGWRRDAPASPARRGSVRGSRRDRGSGHQAASSVTVAVTGGFVGVAWVRKRKRSRITNCATQSEPHAATFASSMTAVRANAVEPGGVGPRRGEGHGERRERESGERQDPEREQLGLHRSPTGTAPHPPTVQLERRERADRGREDVGDAGRDGGRAHEHAEHGEAGRRGDQRHRAVAQPLTQAAQVRPDHGHGTAVDDVARSTS